MQFSLSSLLWVTTVAALLFAALQVCIRFFPGAYFVTAILSIPIAIIGFAMLVFSGFMAFSIWITPAEDIHRRENLSSCFRLFVAGVTLTLPFSYFLASFLIVDPF